MKAIEAIKKIHEYRNKQAAYIESSSIIFKRIFEHQQSKGKTDYNLVCELELLGEQLINLSKKENNKMCQLFVDNQCFTHKEKTFTGIELLRIIDENINI